ncbi:MAG: hypothetical protein LBF92_06425 [Synergistaceae bacterium]|nr:hypothetical protein [Synergistaceae bacterium]
MTTRSPRWESRSSWRTLAQDEPLVSLKQGEASVSLGVIGIGGGLEGISYLILEIEGRGDITPDSAALLSWMAFSLMKKG